MRESASAERPLSRIQNSADMKVRALNKKNTPGLTNMTKGTSNKILEKHQCFFDAQLRRKHFIVYIELV